MLHRLSTATQNNGKVFGANGQRVNNQDTRKQTTAKSSALKHWKQQEFLGFVLLHLPLKQKSTN